MKNLAQKFEAGHYTCTWMMHARTLASGSQLSSGETDSPDLQSNYNYFALNQTLDTFYQQLMSVVCVIFTT